MLSDCEKCWNTPCNCGWDYKDYNSENFAMYISNIIQYRPKEDAIKILELAILNIQNNKNFKEKIKK